MMMRKLLASVALLTTAGLAAGGIVDGMNASTPCQSGDRKHDVMGPIARQLSDADVANLAAFWNSLPVGGAQKEAVAAAVSARRPQMTFPADFPAAYVNYYTQEDAPTKSVTRYYANSVALQAARAGQSLPNGSIIMVEGATGGATRRRCAAKRTTTRCASHATRASRPTASCSRSAS